MITDFMVKRKKKINVRATLAWSRARETVMKKATKADKAIAEYKKAKKRAEALWKKAK